MKKPNTISNETEALSDNVHRNSQWLVTANKRAKKQLSPKTSIDKFWPKFTLTE